MNPRVDLDFFCFAGSDLDFFMPMGGCREKPFLSLLVGSGDPVTGDRIVSRRQGQSLPFILRPPFEAVHPVFRSPEEQLAVCDGAGYIACFTAGFAGGFRGGRRNPHRRRQFLRTKELDEGPPGPGGSPRSGGPVDLAKPGTVK